MNKDLYIEIYITNTTFFFFFGQRAKCQGTFWFVPRGSSFTHHFFCTISANVSIVKKTYNIWVFVWKLTLPSVPLKRSRRFRALQIILWDLLHWIESIIEWVSEYVCVLLHWIESIRESVCVLFIMLIVSSWLCYMAYSVQEQMRNSERDILVRVDLDLNSRFITT